MLTVVIYLVIGGLGLALLIFLFIQVGKKEYAASPHHTWENAIKEYGDPAIANLYQNAKSDGERSEIAAFVNGELGKREPEAKKSPVSATEEKDIVLSRLENINMSREPESEESLENTKLSMENILAAPAYNFWQEPAVKESFATAFAEDFQEKTFAEPVQKRELDAAGGTRAICAVCGNPLEADYDFCIICGTKIVDEASVKEKTTSEQELRFKQKTYEPDEESDAGELQSVCPFCGELIDKNDTFCINCGAKITHETPPETGRDAIEHIINEGQRPLSGRDYPAEAAREQTGSQASRIVAEPARCPLCGEHVDKDDAFCIVCGTPLQNPRSADPFARPEPDEAPLYASDRFDESEADDTEENPFANTSFTLSQQAQNDIPEEQITISLQDILNNVRALEEKIITESAITDPNKQAPSKE